MVAPVGLTDAAKSFYVPDQGSLSLVLCDLGQHGPIFTGPPGASGQRRLSQSNHIEDEHTSGRQRLGGALKKKAYKMVGIGTLGVIGQGFAQGNNRVKASDRNVIDRGVNEVRRGNIRARKFQQVGRSIYTGYVKSGRDERFRQGPGAATHVHDSPDRHACTLQAPHNLPRRAPGKGFECCGMNIRQVALVGRLHPFDSGGSVGDLQFGTSEVSSLSV